MERRILVVDDEPDVLVSLVDLLAELPGASVNVASSYNEASRFIATEDWTMVIADQWLPDGRGVDLLTDLRRRQPGALRVLMSAHQDFGPLVEGINHAAIDHFVAKPYDPLSLLLWVSKRLADHGPTTTPRRGPAWSRAPVP